MRTSLIRTIVAASLALLAAGCGGTTTEQGVGPTATRCQIALTTPPPFPPAASTATISITTARDCTWTASSNVPWATLNPTTGQGTASLTLSIADNALTQSRSASIAVNENTLNITQAGVPCRYQLGSDHAYLDAGSGRTSVRVTTTDGCDWRASVSAGWIRVLTGQGSGTGNAEFELSRNDGGERSATASIAGLSFLITQGGVSSVPPGAPPPPISCTFAIDPDRAAFRSPAGQGSIRIVTEAGCAWTATTSASWLSVSHGSGNGPDTLQYAVAANTSTTSDRSGTISVAGRTHTVSQQACSLSLDQQSQTFSSPGGDGSVRVMTDPGCQWSASSTGDWLSLQQSSGAGPETLRYRVAMNVSTTADRSGSITVSGRTLAIRQLPFRPEEISAEGVLSNVSGSCPAFTFMIGSRVFVTDSRTSFDACDKVRSGIRAFVRGDLQPDGRVLVTRLEIDD